MEVINQSAQAMASAIGRLPAPILTGQPYTALAPMQDVTDLTFMRLMGHYGSPDFFFTEFLRVHTQSRPEKHIVASIRDHGTGRPVFAQLIGEDLDHLERTVRELAPYPAAGIDLNLGCPAPKVYKKNVGGGLLRDPAKIDAILERLRAVCGDGLFTVKMRIGFEDTRHFHEILSMINRHRVDLLSIHGRTVREMYRGGVHYEYIAEAVKIVNCPVLANGNITSSQVALDVIKSTGAAGVMIGRHAIRNPWIFRQCREAFAGAVVFAPLLSDVREYVERLFFATRNESIPERAHVNKMKKYLNFVGQGVDSEGAFLHDMRRTQSAVELFAVCDQHLLSNPTKPFAPEPYAGVVARPNCEDGSGADGCSLDSISS